MLYEFNLHIKDKKTGGKYDPGGWMKAIHLKWNYQEICTAGAIHSKSGLALLLTHFGLFASLPAEVSTQAGIPISFANAAATHIVRPRLRALRTGRRTSLSVP